MWLGENLLIPHGILYQVYCKHGIEVSGFLTNISYSTTPSTTENINVIIDTTQKIVE